MLRASWKSLRPRGCVAALPDCCSVAVKWLCLGRLASFQTFRIQETCRVSHDAGQYHAKLQQHSSSGPACVHSPYAKSRNLDGRAQWQNMQAAASCQVWAEKHDADNRAFEAVPHQTVIYFGIASSHGIDTARLGRFGPVFEVSVKPAKDVKAVFPPDRLRPRWDDAPLCYRLSSGEPWPL